MRWFISLLIILGILGGSAYAINQRDKPVYVLDTRTYAAQRDKAGKEVIP